MRIGEVAPATCLSLKTIRFYESVGLIPPAARSAKGYRTDGPDDLARLRFIQRARQLGVGVGAVATLLELWHDGARASAAVKALALDPIGEINRSIAGLREMRHRLARLAEACHGDARPDCPILEDYLVSLLAQF